MALILYHVPTLMMEREVNFLKSHKIILSPQLKKWLNTIHGGQRRRRAQPKKGGKFKLDPMDKIQAKMGKLDKKLSKINLASSNPSQVNFFFGKIVNNHLSDTLVSK